MKKRSGNTIITHKKMCWSAHVSILFGTIHLGTAYWAFRKNKMAYVNFTCFYALMEFFQAAQWICGDLLPPSQFGYPECPIVNRLFTVTAHALIWYQPILFTEIGLLFTKSGMGLLRVMARITFCWAGLLLFLGHFWIPTYYLPGANYGLTTCSEIGLHGHIGWRFSPISVKYHPTDFIYILFIIMALSMYPIEYKLTLGLGWVLTMFYSLWSVGTGIELPAYWCFLSLFVDPLIWYDLLIS